MLAAGGKVEQQTRLWSESQAKTMPMRSKEEAMDYRYFPDPDLPPIVLQPAEIERVRGALPELPASKRERFQRELGLTTSDALVLTAHPALAQLFERTTERLLQAGKGAPEPARAGKRAANFIQAELLGKVRLQGLSADTRVTPEALGELLWLLESGEISGKMAKEALPAMLDNARGAREVLADKGLSQLSDASEIERLAREIVGRHPDNVAAYRAGKQNVLGWFVGQVMKASSGRANPKLVNETLRKLLEQA